MHPFLSRVGGAWLAVSGIVAGVDTYQGLPCAPGINLHVSSSTDGSTLVNALLAVPEGAINGVLYNFTQAIGANGGQCGADNYTHRIGNGLADQFNMNGIKTIYYLNQAVLGMGGAAIGGIVAEEVQVFSARPRPS
jgi:hypothetical protein